MDRKPFAITLDPGSSLANHTGNWRTMRPVSSIHNACGTRIRILPATPDKILAGLPG